MFESSLLFLGVLLLMQCSFVHGMWVSLSNSSTCLITNQRSIEYKLSTIYLCCLSTAAFIPFGDLYISHDAESNLDFRRDERTLWPLGYPTALVQRDYILSIVQYLSRNPASVTGTKNRCDTRHSLKHMISHPYTYSWEYCKIYHESL